MTVGGNAVMFWLTEFHEMFLPIFFWVNNHTIEQRLAHANLFITEKLIRGVYFNLKQKLRQLH